MTMQAETAPVISSPVYAKYKGTNEEVRGLAQSNAQNAEGPNLVEQMRKQNRLKRSRKMLLRVGPASIINIALTLF